MEDSGVNRGVRPFQKGFKGIYSTVWKKNYLNVLNIGSATGFTSVLLSKFSNYVFSLESEKSSIKTTPYGFPLLSILC